MLGVLLSSLVSTPNRSTGEASENLLMNLKDVVSQITELIKNSTTFGHVTFDLEIPGYLHPTKNSQNKVYWVITDFSAAPCPQFLRGVYGETSESDKTALSNTITDEALRESYMSSAQFRPKPLWFDFNVTLETNQVMSREQYIALLLGTQTNPKATVNSQSFKDSQEMQKEMHKYRR